MRSRTIIVCVLLFALTAVDAAQQQPSRSVWDGVYTNAQADRGARLFAEHCASCHSPDMKGGPGVPGLTGAEFTFSWNNKSAGALFELMQATMPLDAPGALTRQQYADIVAALFRGTAFPAHAERELSPEKAALDDVLIVKKE